MHNELTGLISPNGLNKLLAATQLTELIEWKLNLVPVIALLLAEKRVDYETELSNLCEELTVDVIAYPEPALPPRTVG